MKRGGIGDEDRSRRHEKITRSMKALSGHLKIVRRDTDIRGGREKKRSTSSPRLYPETLLQSQQMVLFEVDILSIRLSR